MKRYKVIYADPPWKYDKNNGGGSALPQDYHYSKMDLADIMRMPIREIANKNSVLFLWGTVPMLPEAMWTMNAWGYKYKTLIAWHKPGLGCQGFWFRGQMEILLFGIKGKVKPFGLIEANFIEAKRREHSQKPEEIYELLAKVPLDPRIELFARKKHSGWDIMGNEIKGSIGYDGVHFKEVV